MPENTPYIVVREGQTHMVEAASPAKAILHVVRDLGVTVKPATGRELSAFHRAGGEMLIAGQPKPDETRPGANIHGIGPDTDGGPNPNYGPETDASKLQHGRAEEIAEEGPGKVTRRRARSGLTVGNGDVA